MRRILTISTILAIILVSNVHCCWRDNNGFRSAYYQVLSSWHDGRYWKHDVTIKSRFKGSLHSWELQLQFAEPLMTSIETWNAQPFYINSRNVVLKPLPHNRVIGKRFRLSYIAGFQNKLGRNHLICATFCGISLETSKSICDTAITTQPPKTTKQTTSNQPSKPKQTTRQFTTAKPNHCLNNFKYEFKSQWYTGQYWKTSADIKPTFKNKLTNWEIRIEFVEPLAESIVTWVMYVQDWSNGKRKVILKPLGYNKVLTPERFHMSYFASFKSKQNRKHLKCFEFCGIDVSTNKNICNKEIFTTTTVTITSKTTSGSTSTKIHTTTSSTTTTQTNTPTTNKPTIATTTQANTPTTTSPITTRPITTTTTTKIQDTTPLTTSTSTTAATTTPPTHSTPTTENTSTSIPCKPKYNYSEVLEKSLLFYEAQRSGKLPSNQRVKWRKDSTMTDGSNGGLDLAGGYFDAGDYVKFGFPMAATITNLAWGMLEFTKGYQMAGQLNYGLQAVKWGTDYFVKCHRKNYVFYGQVGDADIDH